MREGRIAAAAAAAASPSSCGAAIGTSSLLGVSI